MTKEVREERKWEREEAEIKRVTGWQEGGERGERRRGRMEERGRNRENYIKEGWGVK